jgi:hypothetical protein
MSLVISATGIMPNTSVGMQHLNEFELKTILLVMHIYWIHEDITGLHHNWTVFLTEFLMYI